MTAIAAPERFTAVRYRCPFCHRSRSSKRATAGHIARCWLNPAVRSCKTCANYRSDPGGEPCFPGRPCNCNDGGEWCEQGQEIPAAHPFTGCPLWALRAEGTL